jgi:hypothetical protein
MRQRLVDDRYHYDKTLVVATHAGGLREIGRLEIQDVTAWGGVALANGIVYQTRPSEREILLVDIQDPSGPVEIGRLGLESSERPQGLVARGPYAYFLLEGEGLHVVDAHDPTRPTVARRRQVRAGIDGLSIHDRYLVAQGLGLTVFDLSEPLHPQMVGRLVSPEYAPVTEYYLHGFELVGSTLYASHELVMVTGMSVFQLGGAP